MIDLKEIFFDCVSCSDEYEWFEFKSNHVSPDDIGTYISALSNSAAMLGREDSYVFLAWTTRHMRSKGQRSIKTNPSTETSHFSIILPDNFLQALPSISRK